ncbi:predicted protein, partial [Postia placenta Mad-698-R]
MSVCDASLAHRGVQPPACPPWCRPATTGVARCRPTPSDVPVPTATNAPAVLAHSPDDAKGNPTVAPSRSHACVFACEQDIPRRHAHAPRACVMVLTGLVEDEDEDEGEPARWHCTSPIARATCETICASSAMHPALCRSLARDSGSPGSDAGLRAALRVGCQADDCPRRAHGTQDRTPRDADMGVRAVGGFSVQGCTSGPIVEDAASNTREAQARAPAEMRVARVLALRKATRAAALRTRRARERERPLPRETRSGLTTLPDVCAERSVALRFASCARSTSALREDVECETVGQRATEAGTKGKGKRRTIRGRCARTEDVKTRPSTVRDGRQDAGTEGSGDDCAHAVMGSPGATQLRGHRRELPKSMRGTGDRQWSWIASRAHGRALRDELHERASLPMWRGCDDQRLRRNERLGMMVGDVRASRARDELGSERQHRQSDARRQVAVVSTAGHEFRINLACAQIFSDRSGFLCECVSRRHGSRLEIARGDGPTVFTNVKESTGVDSDTDLILTAWKA